jgi:hypothetical protein
VQAPQVSDLVSGPALFDLVVAKEQGVEAELPAAEVMRAMMISGKP